MTFNSFGFYPFFVLVVVVHYILPKRWRWIWLLISSYVFYGLSDLRFLLVLLICTTFSYFTGLQIEKNEEKSIKKAWMLAGVLSIVGILIIFKYLNFFFDSFGIVLASVGLQWNFRGIALFYPIGISFYSFQVISYLLDLNSGKSTAERNIFQYALFVSFFPQLLIGPIERFSHLKSQLFAPAPFEWQKFVDSFVRIGWGLFKKFVIADRLAMVANIVFAAPTEFHSGQLIVGILAFSFQIYIDFSAYCDIAIGTASALGISLVENFEQPFLARSVIDFWRRWHISLSTWLRDYVFLKLNYKHRRKKPRWLWMGLDVMTTFLISGLWHGANWTFIVWGLLHGAFQTIELLTQKLREKITRQLHINRDAFLPRIFQVLLTFSLVSFAWIFFKADSVRQAFEIIGSFIRIDGLPIGQGLNIADGALGLDSKDFVMMAASLGISLIIEWVHSKHDLLAVLNKQSTWLRWGMYYALIFAIVIFGFYGDANVIDFVYFQF